MLTRGIRNLPICLEISGIQCIFVVNVRAFRTFPQRLAVDSRSPSGDDALESVAEKRLQFIPRSVRAATKQSRHMLRVFVMRLLRVIGRCRSRSACCPRRDVVRGWQHRVHQRDGLCFLVAPRSEKIDAHGRQKRRHVDDE